MKQSLRKVAAVVCGSMLLAVPVFDTFTASAATVDDVIAAAYAVGIPDQYVQEGIYMYAGGNYSSEQCDAAISQIYSYQGRVDSLLYDYFGVEPNGSSNGDDDNKGDTSGSTTTGSSGAGENTPSKQDPSSNENQGNTSTAPETDKSFVDMSMDEKIEYVNQMPAEERANYLENLTVEERNSFIKQLSMDDKAAVLNDFLGVGDAIGLNFTVDELTGDSVVISARDQDGKLIDVSAMGVTIENTGKSYTLPIVIAAGLAGIGISGISALLFFTGKKKHGEDEA